MQRKEIARADPSGRGREPGRSADRAEGHVNSPERQVERVLLVTPDMEPRGTSEYAVGLARQFQARGVETAVFCGPGPMLGALAQSPVTVGTFKRLESPWFRFTERERFLAELSRFSPQIVHGQTCRMLPLIRDLARRVSMPIVMTLHGPPPRMRVFRRLSGRLAGVIATTQDVREELVNRARVAKSKIAVVANGIDLNELRARKIRPIFSGDAAVVGSIGPVEKARGHELFVRAAARLVRAGEPLQFLIGGQGSELPGLRRLASSLGLDNCLTFAGDLFSYDQAMDAADVVVQSSQVDVSGFSILKAMGYGRPVIAFNTGTACEIVEDGKTGLLVPREDVARLAQAIEKLTRDPERSRRMGQAAFARASERFNVEKVAETTLDFYAGLLSARG